MDCFKDSLVSIDDHLWHSVHQSLSRLSTTFGIFVHQCRPAVGGGISLFYSVTCIINLKDGDFNFC